MYISDDEFDGLFERIIQYSLSYDSFMDASLDWDTLKIEHHAAKAYRSSLPAACKNLY